MPKRETIKERTLPNTYEYELPGGWKVIVGKENLYLNTRLFDLLLK